MDARLPVRRLKESRASTRYGVSLLERSLLIGLRSVLLSGVVAINLNQCPGMTAGRLGADAEPRPLTHREVAIDGEEGEFTHTHTYTPREGGREGERGVGGNLAWCEEKKRWLNIISDLTLTLKLNGDLVTL